MPKKATKKKSHCASEECCFWVYHGPVLKDLKGLSKELGKMTDDTFKHHVNKSKNDFANWIEHVFNEKGLADKIRKIKTQTTTKKTLDVFLKG